jgi:hypothetical protein
VGIERRDRKVARVGHTAYDRRTKEAIVVECDVCSAMVSEVRRGRCWGCYNRWAEHRPVGAGARCVLCGERRRSVLRSVELLGSWQPTCFNCHGQLAALDPVPPTLAEVRTALERERRKVERRIGKPDTRVFRYERRVGERRTTSGDEWASIDDDMIIEIVIDPGEGAGDFEEMTRIHALPIA